MHSDMQALKQFDPIMHLFIINDYFETSPTVESYVAEYNPSLEELQEIYGNIAEMLNHWRDDDIIGFNPNV